MAKSREPVQTTTSESPQIEADLARLHAASFGWALSCCGGNRHDAEEVLHQVYECVLDGGARFGGRSAFQTWLFGVIRRTAAAERRRMLLRSLRLLRYEEQRERSIPAPAPDEALERSQVATLLRQALGELPRRQRESLTLVFYHGLTLAEAAEVMAISVGSVRTHYDRGKKHLRQWIEQQGISHETAIRPSAVATTLS